MAEIYFTYTIEPGAKVLKWKINQSHDPEPPAPEPQFVNFPKCDNLDAIEWNKIVEIDGNEPNLNLNFPPPAIGDENLQQIVIVGTSPGGINLTINSAGENFVFEDGSEANPFFYAVPPGRNFISIATFNETANNILITVKEF